ncbi:MAG: DUF2559 family protein [Gammaproteobacteria bacterium]|nr:DUF2559 family protein [Gammaproteobacteria bacterium]
MNSPDFKAKRAYFAKVRRSNYEASLRLEGIKVSGTSAKVLISSSQQKASDKESNSDRR